MVLVRGIACLLLLLGVVVSCKNTGKLEEIGAPDWVFDSKSVAVNDKEISAVGIGEPSKGGLKVQIAQAQADGRANIANQVLSEITRISKDAIRKTDVSNLEDVEKIFSQATQEVVRDLPISGAVQTHIWQDPKSDYLYTRMAIDSKRVAEHFESSMQIYDKRLKQAGLDKSQKDTNALLQSFDKDIQNSFDKQSGKQEKIKIND